MINKDYELIGRSLQDVIIEPIRSILIPGFDTIKESAIEAGALGCGISGSGPSIFAFSKSRKTAEKAGAAMQEKLKELKINNDLYISKINKEGPKVIG